MLSPPAAAAACGGVATAGPSNYTYIYIYIHLSIYRSIDLSI